MKERTKERRKERTHVHVISMCNYHASYTAHGHHQMINTKIILIISFAVEDGEALYSQQKKDRELTVAQIMNS